MISGSLFCRLSLYIGYILIHASCLPANQHTSNRWHTEDNGCLGNRILRNRLDKWWREVPRLQPCRGQNHLLKSSLLVVGRFLWRSPTLSFLLFLRHRAGRLKLSVQLFLFQQGRTLYSHRQTIRAMASLQRFLLPRQREKSP